MSRGIGSLRCAERPSPAPEAPVASVWQGGLQRAPVRCGAAVASVWQRGVQRAPPPASGPLPRGPGEGFGVGSDVGVGGEVGRAMSYGGLSKAPARSSPEEDTTTGDGARRGGHDPADPVSAVSEPCELRDDSMTPGGSAAVVDEPRRLIHRRDKPAGVGCLEWTQSSK